MLVIEGLHRWSGGRHDLLPGSALTLSTSENADRSMDVAI
jgi:hypothetical protein